MSGPLRRGRQHHRRQAQNCRVRANPPPRRCRLLEQEGFGYGGFRECYGGKRANVARNSESSELHCLQYRAAAKLSGALRFIHQRLFQVETS